MPKLLSRHQRLIGLVVALAISALGAQAAAAQTLSVNDITIAETTASPAVGTFTITMSVASQSSVTVNYATFNGTATAPGDYVSASGTATFDPGDTTEQVTVSVVGDPTDEENENFQLRLSSPVGATISDGIGQATINDDDGPPTVSVAAATVQGGAEGTNANRLMVFSISLSAVSERPIKVDYETQPDTAVGPTTNPDQTMTPGDFQPKTGTLNFAGGTTQQQVTVVVIGDTVDELDETFNLHLKEPVENVTIAEATGVGTILDDDGPTLSTAAVSVDEGGPDETKTVTVTLSLDAASPQDVSVAYSSADDGATAGVDYDALPSGQRLTIPHGQLIATIPITIRGDDIDELDERLRVNIGTPEDVTIGNNSSNSTITIVDDDATPGLVVSDVTVAEGTASAQNTSATLAKLQVGLTRDAGRVLNIKYATGNGSALAGVDFQGASTTDSKIDFNPGETTKEISLQIAPDADVEEDETFTISFQFGDEAPVATVTVKIIDDDLTAANQPRMTITDTTVREGDSGSVEAVFVVKLDKVLARTVTANYTTADGTATAPDDYGTAKGVVSFAPGETTQLIRVVVNADTLLEHNDDFTVVLSDAANARLFDTTGIGVIIDDDAGGGPISVAPSPLKASSLLCRRRCNGLLVQWKVQAEGTIHVVVTGTLPKSGKSRQARVLQLASKRVKVKPGAGKARVKRIGRSASRMLGQLRTAKATKVHVVVTFTNRSGGQQRTEFDMPVKL